MALTKKIVHVFLAAVLLLATVGITMNKHYCMGRLKSVAVYEHAHGCSGSGMTDPMPCCEDVSDVLKVEEMAQTAFDFKLATIDLILPIAPRYDLSPVPLILRQPIPVNNHAPPPDGVELIILHQVFRI